MFVTPRGLLRLIGAVATVRPSDDGVVYGVLHTITSMELAWLDLLEATTVGLYRRTSVRVWAQGLGVKEAHVYIVVSGSQGGQPRASYVRRILEGMQEFDLPVSPLEGRGH
jgi:hypothetical protein